MWTYLHIALEIMNLEFLCRESQISVNGLLHDISFQRIIDATDSRIPNADETRDERLDYALFNNQFGRISHAHRKHGEVC